jgi:hypothetical protein
VPSNEPDTPDELKPAVALRRLVYLAVIGCVLIIAFAVRSGGSSAPGTGTTPTFFRMASVGLMAAGAALLAGGLLGFLFGVPYIRDKGDGASRTSGDSGGTESAQTAASSRKEERDDDGEIAYRPNTSLEQIIDWLTKIIVGVSLVEFRSILERLKSAATFVGNGLDGSQQAYAIASTIFIYFGVSGFVFGFLWARLYLPQWFYAADKIRKLAKKVSQLEADAKAFALAAQQAKLLSSAPPASDDEILNAVTAASPSAKAQILGQVTSVLNDKDTDKDQTKVDGVISVLRGLISSEPEAPPESHFQLSRAWRKKKPSNFAAALEEINDAIAIRDKRKIGGWITYEFHRALIRIELDGKSATKKPSDAGVKEDIVKDLRAVAGDGDQLERHLEWGNKVVNWMTVNNVTVDQLRQP